MRQLLPIALIGLACVASIASPERLHGQATSAESLPEPVRLNQAAAPEVPDKVEVQAVVDDDAIAVRLRRILTATGWFAEPAVDVDDGVVFLEGRTERDQYKEWAGDLARKTRDVVAVVNRITVEKPSQFDFEPALDGLRDLWSNFNYWIPFILLAFVVLGITYVSSRLLKRGLRPLLERRVRVALLREVLTRAAGLAVLLLGLYIVLRISGLTRLALTVIGGTGLFGLVLGIAFRDIAENFLASILLSVQSPFRTGDLVEIAGIKGIVQQLNVRVTVLISLSGNQELIPNALVYKSPIRNFSANTNLREDFTIGIGYDVDIPQAQEIAQRVMAEHPAVLKTPEPWVLVDKLGAATVDLRIYFWLDGSRYSNLKVRSAIIRLVKRAFQDAGISLPDEAREIVFPAAVPIRMLPEDATLDRHTSPANKLPSTKRTDLPVVKGENDLQAEAEQLKSQAQQTRMIDPTENLLPSAPEVAPNRYS